MPQHGWFAIVLLCALAPSAAAHGGRTGDDPAAMGIVWEPRTARHLLSRAGFGATPEELRAALSSTPEQVVEDLLGRADTWVDIEPELFRWEMFGLDHMQLPIETTDYYGLERDEQVARCKNARNIDRDQFLELYQRYFDSIHAGRDPLRDRMTLFLHGFFTTSWEVNKRKFELIHQFQFLRSHALESYAELLSGIVRDPAMLQYLDNTSNSLQHPNENLARELMELFSLGEGRFSERDVKEAARALTGHTGNAVGRYEFLPDRHDGGEKTILGVRGPHDAQDLVRILLAQPECAEWVARRLLRFFEGVEPEPARLALYAERLRAADYELRPFLRRLFLDPEFYRAEIVDRRVHGPIEYLAVMGRRLDASPTPRFLLQALEHLGQGLFHPPSVKGWPEGLEWMTTDALARRSNCAGVWLGRIDATGERPGSPSEAFFRELGAALEGRAWTPPDGWVARLCERGAEGDDALAAELVQAWLGIRDTARARSALVEFLARERRALNLEPATGFGDPDHAREVLRRAAHLVFSLPEAQLG